MRTRPARRDVTRRQGRTRLLTIVMALTAGLLYAFVVRGLPAPREHLPVALFVALFFAAEVFVVHVQYRKDAHTVSLVDVPLVLGLFFVSPTWLMPAHLIGAAVALGGVRRQRPVKLHYNLAAFAL